jgi:hypothetical protein
MTLCQRSSHALPQRAHGTPAPALCEPTCKQQTMIALPEDVVFRADVAPDERERLLSMLARKG